MTILFSSSHFKRQIYKKNDKNEQKKTKKEPVVKKIMIKTLFSKLISNFAKSDPFYKGTL